MRGIPLAALARFDQLRVEDKEVDRLLEEQVGTSIPTLFSTANSYVVNPSSIGTGFLSRMIDTDDAVSSSVQFKTLMILSKMGDYYHPNAEINDHVNAYLANLAGPTWAEAKESMLSAKAYGFSVSEFTCKLDSKMRKVPTQISTYHPSTIAFECDHVGKITPDGVLQFVYQQTQFSNPNNRFFGVQYGSRLKNPFETPTDRILPHRIPFMNQYGLARIPRRKVIHMTNLPMLSFGSPYGKTEVRTAHLAWALKQFTLRQLGIAIKRNANTFLWATAPQGVANVEVKLPDGRTEKLSPAQALTELLKARESDDSITTGPRNNGYEINPITSTANLDQFLNTVNALDTRIFRCFLLPSLVMTEGSAGSRALGDKHFEIVGRVADEEASKCGQTIVNDMIKPLIIENFGVQSEEGGYGSFKSRPQSTEERERLAAMFSTLTTSGILKNHVKKDMEYIRQSLSLPKDTDTSFDLGTSPIEVNEADKVPPGTQAPKPSKDAEGDESASVPAEKPSSEETPTATASEPAPENILNGAQVTALKDLVKDFLDGKIPRETAIEIMKSAFKYDAETANRILGKPGFVPSSEPEAGEEPKPEGDEK